MARRQPPKDWTIIHAYPTVEETRMVLYVEGIIDQVRAYLTEENIPFKVEKVTEREAMNVAMRPLDEVDRAMEILDRVEDRFGSLT